MTPEEQAAIAANITGNAPAAQAAPVLPAPPPIAPEDQDTIWNRIAGSASRFANSAPIQFLGGKLLAPINESPLDEVQRKLTESAPRDITGFQKDTPEARAAVAAAQIRGQEPMAPGGTVDRTARLSKAAQGAAGAGGPAGPSLYQQYQDAQKKRMGLADQGVDAQRDVGIAERVKMDRDAELGDLEAAQKERFGQIQQEEAEREFAKHDAFIQDSTRMADELAQQKVDPKRLFRDQSTWDKVQLGAGAAIGGWLAGWRGDGDNKFLDQVNRDIDRDLKAQELELDNKRAALSQRNSILSQMVQTSGNLAAGRTAARAMMLQGVKQHIEGEMLRAGIPVADAKNSVLVNKLEQDVSAMREQAAKENYARAQAAAAAAAAQRAAAEQKTWDRMIQLKTLQNQELQIRGERAKDVDSRVEKLGQTLGDEKFQKGKAVTDALAAQVARTPEGEQLPGLGWGGGLVGALPGGQHLLSDQQNVNRQNWDDFLGVLRVQRTGSGAGQKELELIQKEAEGAGTAAERANVINKAQAFFANQEKFARAGAGPEASRKFDENIQTLSGELPASVKRKDGDGGR